MQEGTSSPLPEPPYCSGRSGRLRRIASRLKSASGSRGRSTHMLGEAVAYCHPWDCLRDHCVRSRSDRTRRWLASARVKGWRGRYTRLPTEMRRTRIVCTLGPSTTASPVVRRLIAAGMDVARLNFSHGDADTHRRTVDTVRQAACAAGRHVAL